MNLRVTSSGGLAAALLWALALSWSAAVAFFVALVARSDAPPPAPVWLALAVFGGAGVHLLTLAIRTTAGAAALRNSSIDLHSADLGGKVAGVVTAPPGTLHLTLSNWRSGDPDELLWESMTTTLAAAGPFSFDVPYDCEPTSSAASWRLVLESGPHTAGFTIPVLRTDASSPAQTRHALRARWYPQPDDTKIEIDGAAVRFPLPSWLWRWFAIVAALIGAGYLAATYVYHVDFVAAAVIAIIVFSVIPLPTLAMTVRRIDADSRGLTFRYVLGRRKRIDNVRDVSAVYANGALHYELAIGGAAPPWTIVRLANVREAEWVAYELRRALGLV